MEAIAPGIYRWTAPHPEYRPRAEEVVSYALVGGEALALVDPLLPAGDDARLAPLLTELGRLAGAARRLELLITVPYHTRSAEALYQGFREHLPTRIWGHGLVRRRLAEATPLEVVPRSAAGVAAPVAGGLALAFTIGRPRRSEYPLYFPGLRAVVFGDAVVGTRHGPRLWDLSGTGAAWYRDVFAPTLRPLLDQDVEHVLVTHGPAVLGGGRRALEECLAAEPVAMY